ncbi:PREDICTED: uncharacterized protein LOC105367824 [Ceratosolen solmsi marchali]|uniref:Uncharacterized protein LOC105367824 n=1 Tax=Ceratosolen solmsi marchali TaxID=326594 RepID=A0AAJ6YV32_9HYME|nr:PREDICTED: uncharacterized protein LOC105367824 [Ceratosolen solmsi marchali]XP_011504944.1 PREDICTED: uncharacterized protein LOC105367824 [Ceratosolen solmsi marchali]XP_011504945.1 PREDICTED: uncharacterized protein LOC105367824 [Ceratosolen solmsi marchali]
MTSHIFGVGLGLFVIITLWISAGLVFLVSLRIEKRIGAVALAVAAIVTIVLISVPRAVQHPIAHNNKPYDHLFVWRLILLILLITSTVIGFIGYIKFGLMDIAKPQRIRNWIL